MIFDLSIKFYGFIIICYCCRSLKGYLEIVIEFGIISKKTPNFNWIIRQLIWELKSWNIKELRAELGVNFQRWTISKKFYKNLKSCCNPVSDRFDILVYWLDFSMTWNWNGILTWNLKWIKVTCKIYNSEKIIIFGNFFFFFFF